MKKLSISSDSLKPVLAKLSQAINPKSIVPALLNLYCRITPGQAELIASNTEITIFYRVPCEAAESFEFLVPFEFLDKIVSVNKHCPLTIEQGRLVKIKGPNDEYEFKVGDKITDFPQLPVLPKEQSFEIDHTIISCLRTALATTKSSDPRYAHVLMELAPGKITIASTDGSYMVYSKEFSSEIKETQELLLSQKVIKVLDGCDEVKVCYAAKTIGFEADDITIINTRSEEKFVNFRQVFPEDWPGNLTIQKSDLIGALDKCLFSTDVFHTTKIDLSNPLQIKLSANDDMVKIQVVIAASYAGTVKETAINSEKMMKLMSQVEKDEITLALHDSKKAIIITAKEDPGFKALMMPIPSN